jgi:hypothetical protein
MSYHLAPSLVRLREQINQEWPQRDTTSDGWIGDTRHQAVKSDHNPDYSAGGVVRAIDVDKDGIEVDRLLAAVMSDDRTAYVIFERRIWTPGAGWRTYTGLNPHTSHIHISIKHTATAAASERDWPLTTTPAPSQVKEPEHVKRINRLDKTPTQKLPQREWKYLRMNDKGDVSVLRDPGLFDSDLQITAVDLPQEFTLQARAVLVEKVKDGSWAIVTRYPITEPRGTSGQTFISQSQKGTLAQGRRLRWQVWTDAPGAAITNVSVRTDLFN